MPRRDVSMTPEQVAEFLAAPRTAVLSTLAPDGGPHCAGMWFWFDGKALRMWTYAKSQKARNLQRDPRCALLVETGTAYDELKGVLVRGRAEIESDYDGICRIGRELYARYTFPFTGIPVDEGPIVEIERQAQKRVGLLLPFDRVASWDHSKMR